METIEKAKAKYQSATTEQKKILEDIFGKEKFSAIGWMECWEEFCKKYNKTIELPYPNASNADQEYLNAQCMMMHIVRHYRKKRPDFRNSNEIKYQIWADLSSPSGSGFSRADYGVWRTGTGAGSRLCFPDDSKTADMVATQYAPILEILMTEPE